MGYMSVICCGEVGNAAFIGCGGEVKLLNDCGELKRFTFPPVTTAKHPTKANGEEAGDEPQERDEQSSGRVLGVCVSPSGRLVAALNDHKTACVWRAEDGGRLASWQTTRKGSCLTFSRDEQALLVADKSGDVYKCQLGEPETKPQLILGHICMVLDMCVTGDGHHLLTSDRDEKVRVTRYPNTWSIAAYCLGHTEFVSALCLTAAGRLVTGGGDMTVRLWDPESGRQLACCPVAAEGSDSSNSEQKVAVVSIAAVQAGEDSLLVVRVHSWSRLVVLSVSGDTLTPRPDLEGALRQPAAPWAVAAAADRLLVLRPDPEAPLVEYRAAADGRLTLQPAGARATAAARLWSELKETFEVPEEVTWLFKQWFDNVADYKSKKEERLRGEKKTKTSEESSPKRLKSAPE
ncbi:tRNA (guanine-N(7)-)-methyltransferase non-catalytic subunit wdr4-like [Amphibalanus amphitrite]|uniref:tRNA (guanine-N(7)-)-methyltransferase non-catalytic subunit wdr4-like n=1 Tax=Amphibalanus amphitrite TaxID=1232801 RepID=UPI001C920563|nr:tRNA (guanine-N(7)-)-methyltransferase non-catalytic subunit wdr4-like [Amphibalanus amphitrite]